jgi:N-formylglutamate amidohydrolase
VPVVHATVSRFVVDLNRSATPLELYPGRMETGVVPVETFWGEPVWADPPTDAETSGNIER